MKNSVASDDRNEVVSGYLECVCVWGGGRIKGAGRREGTHQLRADVPACCTQSLYKAHGRHLRACSSILCWFRPGQGQVLLKHYSH